MVLIFFSCSKINESKLMDEYSLTLTSGGITGKNCTYEIGEITWKFDSKTLTKEINITEDSEGCLSKQERTIECLFELKENDEGYFLFIDDSDRGLVTFTENGFNINSNKYFNGNEGADGFEHYFIRII